MPDARSSYYPARTPHCSSAQGPQGLQQRLRVRVPPVPARPGDVGHHVSADRHHLQVPVYPGHQVRQRIRRAVTGIAAKCGGIFQRLHQALCQHGAAQAVHVLIHPADVAVFLHHLIDIPVVRQQGPRMLEAALRLTPGVRDPALQIAVEVLQQQIGAVCLDWQVPLPGPRLLHDRQRPADGQQEQERGVDSLVDRMPLLGIVVQWDAVFQAAVGPVDEPDVAQADVPDKQDQQRKKEIERGVLDEPCVPYPQIPLQVSPGAEEKQVRDQDRQKRHRAADGLGPQ